MFHFESYFLKCEIVLIILTFATGVLVHSHHKIIILSMNLLFIILCAFVMQNNYPIEKFFFYGLLITSTGAIGYYIHNRFIKLATQLINANSLARIRNIELKQLNYSKDELIQIIGHDLKTPFSNLNSLLELYDKTSDNTEKKNIKKMIRESSISGHNLVISLMNWAQAEKSETILTLTPIHKIIDNAIEFLSLNSNIKKIKIINDTDVTLQLKIDENMIETIIRNLLSNAIKFSYKESFIKVKSEVIKNEVKVSVIDKGVGISNDKINELLSATKNHSTLGTNFEKGSGFGLNICKKLIQNHNGRIEIKSSPNVGTTVDVYIPHLT